MKILISIHIKILDRHEKYTTIFKKLKINLLKKVFDLDPIRKRVKKKFRDL